ncbi:MAG TPA: hypothetical protein EYO96_05415 [Candidatus Marinimicrobia bacterium]|nr:hypothetical protein [Candidatus Neomarinimicrobiota bacterium]
MSFKEIEAAITELPASKLFALSSWFEKYQATVWETSKSRKIWKQGVWTIFWLKSMPSTKLDYQVHFEAQNPATFLGRLTGTS